MQFNLIRTDLIHEGAEMFINDCAGLACYSAPSEAIGNRARITVVPVESGPVLAKNVRRFRQELVERWLLFQTVLHVFWEN